MKSLINLTDQQLVHLYVEGNTNALETLVNRYKDRIYTSIYLLVKDKYMAEDIFQDTFIKIIETLKTGRYTDEGKFLPWAMRIAHNLCVDHFRRIKRTPIIKTSDDRNMVLQKCRLLRKLSLNPAHLNDGFFLQLIQQNPRLRQVYLSIGEVKEMYGNTPLAFSATSAAAAPRPPSNAPRSTSHDSLHAPPRPPAAATERRSSRPDTSSPCR